MSIEKARGALDVIRRQAQIAIEALIDAKLSPAPVGDAYAQAITAGCYPLDDAPTPPAKDTVGEASDFALSDVVFAEQADRVADLEARLAEAARINIAAEQRLKDEIVVERRASHRSELAASAAERALADATKRIEAAAEKLRWDLERDVRFRHDQGEILAILTGPRSDIDPFDALISPASEGKTDG